MKKYFSTFLKGIAMGSVDIVPGISGGTMALILKIYQKIIDELRLINFEFFKNIFNLHFKKAFNSIDWKFLLSLFLGIIIAIISLARIISWALENYPVYLFSFFFGLIIISALLLIPKKNIRPLAIIFLILGFIIAWLISSLTPAQSPETYSFIFLSGALAICAMILPGISGAFILLLIGKYEFMISALKNPLASGNISIIIIFILGCLIGLLAFSKFLSFLLKKYYQVTLMLLIGFMLGALNKIWPFKEILETKIINNYEIIIRQKNIWPAINQELFIAIILAIIGIFIGILLNKIRRERV
jgi:putative membrane protein